MLVLALLGIITAPLENAISRRYEAEADWLALQTTRDPGAAKRLFARFATTSLQQPSPPTWDYVFLENHPTIMQRIAMAAAWRARHASEGSPARSATSRRVEAPPGGS